MKRTWQSRGVRWAAAAAALALAAGALVLQQRRQVARPSVSPERCRAVEALARQVQGEVVFQRLDREKRLSIWKETLGSTSARRLTRDGRYPRWSHDGRVIAFLRGNQVMLMNADGGSERLLARAGTPEPHAVAFAQNDREVLFTDGNALQAVALSNGVVRTVVSGRPYVGADLSRDGTRLITMVSGHEILAYDLTRPSAKPRRIGRGCSASFSPDAELITNNLGGHLHMWVRRWGDGEIVGEYHAPAGLTFDNEAWSNHPRWLVSRTEQPGHQNIFVHDPFQDTAVQVTFVGDADRPDLHVDAGTSDRGDRRTVRTVGP